MILMDMPEYLRMNQEEKEIHSPPYTISTIELGRHLLCILIRNPEYSIEYIAKKCERSVEYLQECLKDYYHEVSRRKESIRQSDNCPD